MQTNNFLNNYFLRFLCVLLLACLVLTGCGFHLRGGGNEQLSLANVRVAIQSPFRYGDFEKSIRQALRNAGAEPLMSSDLIEGGSSGDTLAQGELPQYQLNVVNLQFSSQGVSRDESGRANEQEVTAHLEYQLYTLTGNGSERGNDESLHSEAILSDSNLDREAEQEIQSLSATANFVQDYRNPTGERIQKKETRQLLLQQLSQRLTRRLEYLVKKP